MTVMVWGLGSKGLLPTLTVYDAYQRPVLIDDEQMDIGIQHEQKLYTRELIEEMRFDVSKVRALFCLFCRMHNLSAHGQADALRVNDFDGYLF